MINEGLPKIVVGIVKNSEGQVLIVRRTKEETGTGNAKLLWTFPGGKVEENESMEDAIKREVLEETSLVVLHTNVISQRQHPQFPVHIYYIECILNEKSTVSKPLLEEIKEVKWIDPNSIKDYFTSNLDPGVSLFLGIK